jgi:hypothetical protein
MRSTLLQVASVATGRSVTALAGYCRLLPLVAARPPATIANPVIAVIVCRDAVGVKDFKMVITENFPSYMLPTGVVYSDRIDNPDKWS